MDRRLTTLACCILATLPAAGQTSGKEPPYRVVFYNVENLFDPRDDPATRDDDFTPEGTRHWTWTRYNKKLLNISRALLLAGGQTPPLLIGLAEVENRRVLLDLTRRTTLARADYGIVHADSPDPRGIDVALLYRREHFRPLAEAFLPVRLGKSEPSRDILYCKGILHETDTLHLFVCHFPSMVGGVRASEWKRVAAATILLRHLDSIRRENPRTALIVMGDLNGPPGTLAQRRLGAKPAAARHPSSNALYNTAYHYRRAATGSYRYRGKWQTLDHILVSGSLLNGNFPWQTPSRMSILADETLLDDDKTHYGQKPFPTYHGRRYAGGYSDHLPVHVELTPAPPSG
ncbi:MAG: endonuclease, partial [Odoribacteraceae bacterium]|nr:endonuclease [Odoribacteraceae bacterium]